MLVSRFNRKPIFLLLSVLLPLSLFSNTFQEDVRFTIGLSAWQQPQMYDYAEMQLKKFIAKHKGQNKVEIDIVKVKVYSNLKQKDKARAILNKLKESIKDPNSPFYGKVLEQILYIEKDQAKRFKLYDDYFANVRRPSQRDPRLKDYNRLFYTYMNELESAGRIGKVIEMLPKTMTDPKDEGQQDYVTYRTAQVMLDHAEKLRDEGKPADEVRKWVEKAKKALKKFEWKSPNNAFVILSYLENAHASILLGDAAAADRMLKDAEHFLEPLHQSILKQTKSKAQSPYAQAFYFKGMLYELQAKKTADKAKQKNNYKGAYVSFNKVHKEYNESIYKAKAYTRKLAVGKILEEKFNEPPPKDAVDESILRDQFNMAVKAYKDKNYTGAAEIFIKLSKQDWDRALQCTQLTVVCYISLKKYPDAGKAVDQMAEKFPKDPLTAETINYYAGNLVVEARNRKGTPLGDKINAQAMKYYELLLKIAPTSIKAPDAALRLAENSYAIAYEMKQAQKDKKPFKGEKVTQEGVDAAYKDCLAKYKRLVDNYGQSKHALGAYKRMGGIAHTLGETTNSIKYYTTYLENEKRVIVDVLQVKSTIAYMVKESGNLEKAIDHYKELESWSTKGGKFEKVEGAKTYRVKAQFYIAWFLAKDLVAYYNELQGLHGKLRSVDPKGEKGDDDPTVKQIKADIAAAKKKVDALDTRTVDRLEKFVATFPNDKSYTPIILDNLGKIFKAKGFEADKHGGEEKEIEANRRKFYLESLKYYERLKNAFPASIQSKSCSFQMFSIYTRLGDEAKVKKIAEELQQQVASMKFANLRFTLGKIMEDADLGFTIECVDPDLTLMVCDAILKKVDEKLKANPKDEDLKKQKGTYLKKKAQVLMYNEDYEKAAAVADAGIKHDENGAWWYTFHMIKGNAQAKAGKIGQGIRTIDEALGQCNRNKYPEDFYLLTISKAVLYLESSDKSQMKKALVWLENTVIFAEEKNDRHRPYLERAFYELVKACDAVNEQEKSIQYRKDYNKYYPEGKYVDKLQVIE